MVTQHGHPPTDLKGFRRQRCNVCHCEEKFNFYVPTQTWKKVVPEEYQKKVVCLPCFDSFAQARNVSYSDAIEELYFAGEKAALKFDIASAEDV
jgi:hypothetical protein